MTKMVQAFRYQPNFLDQCRILVAEVVEIRGTRYMEGIGDRLKARSKQLGMKDAEVARRCEITQRRYSYYVNNQRESPFWFVKRVCEVLNVDPNYLYGHESDSDLRERLSELEERMNKVSPKGPGDKENKKST